MANKRPDPYTYEMSIKCTNPECEIESYKKKLADLYIAYCHDGPNSHILVRGRCPKCDVENELKLECSENFHSSFAILLEDLFR